MTRLYYILFLLVLGKNISAQLPVLDSSWEEKLVDNFDSINTTIWCKDYCWGPCNNGLEYNSTNNLSIHNNALRIKCEKLTIPHYCDSTTSPPTKPKYYRSGAIRSKFNYKYGYWEISALQPAAGSFGFWTAFWLYNENCPTYYDELDIMERFGVQSPFSNRYSSVYHSQGGSGSTCQQEIQGKEYPNTVPLDVMFRKYAIEWHPGKFVMYFEGEPVWEVRDQVHTPTNFLSTILNFAIDSAVNANTVFPAYYDIDYIKIYQLKRDCDFNFSSCNFNPNTYDYKVKKSIIIGGSGCTSNISTSQNLALRATDGIEFKEGTTITASGVGWFFADVIPCPQ